MLVQYTAVSHASHDCTAVLQAVHELLQAGRSTSQRDLYYKLLKPPMFRTPGNVDAAVQDVVALLRVPRSSLGVSFYLE